MRNPLLNFGVTWRSRKNSRQAATPGVQRVGLTPREARQRRAFDLAVAGVGAVLTAPVCIAGVVLSTLDTGEWGVFSQLRIGKDGKPIRVHKIRTMRTSTTQTTTVTTGQDPRITPVGHQLRRFKIDELPQLVDVLMGRMSIVGPRPDVPGWADQLRGADRIILSVRPGITGPASIRYRDEEELLAQVPDPDAFNRGVVWPNKVRINREYVENWSIGADVRMVVATAASIVGWSKA